MTTVNVYLNFEGDCEEAFLFYKSVFGGEFSYLSRFKDLPDGSAFPKPLKEVEDKIMHVGLPISKETILMGSDIVKDWTPDFQVGNNFSISVSVDTKEEADRIFSELSKNGRVQMPMELAFWGDYFGQFTDQFGINWMIMHTVEQQQ